MVKKVVSQAQQRKVGSNKYDLSVYVDGSMFVIHLFQIESIVMIMMNHIMIQIMLPPAKIVPLKKVLVVEIANGIIKAIKSSV